MDMQLQNTIGQNMEAGTGAERIRLLLRQAENLDHDSVETFPAIIREIQEISGRIGYEKGGTECLLLQARYLAMNDNYTEAIARSSAALKEFRDASDAMGQVKALSTLGFSYGQLGRLDTALAHFLDGLRLFNENGFDGIDAGALRGNLLNNLASIYGDLGRYDEALQVLEEVQKQAETVGGAPLVMVLSNICEANLKKGNIMEALVYNQRALMEIKTKNLGSIHLYMCQSNFGMIYERSGQPEKALESYHAALDAASRINNRFYTASALAAIGALQMKLGNRGPAMEALDQALGMAEEIHANELLRPLHSFLVEEHERSGDFKEAFLHLKRFVDINTALETREIERKLSNFTAELKVEESKKDMEIYRLKNVELKQKSDEIEQKARELEESFRNIKAIGEIGQRITNSLDAGMILSMVYENMSGLMDTGIFAIGLFDDAMDIVDYRLLVEHGRRLPLFQVSAEDKNSYAAKVIAEGREIMTGDTDDHFTENVAMPLSGAQGRWPKSIICCPLTLSDRIIGVIAVQSQAAHAYSERNLETVKALASYIAIALNNAQQSEELKARAKDLELASRTDILTGLNNRRLAMEKINEECIRFQRSGRTFSVIICDIDFFKKVNDTYGHDCGDAVLKALAGLLGRHIRKQDCLARWGGEEFLLLLPETNASGAAVLAEKLRKRVEEYEFAYAGAKVPITMTFGVAEFIREYGVDACIVGADSALYKGKSDGRNRVVTF